MIEHEYMYDQEQFLLQLYKLEEMIAEVLQLQHQTLSQQINLLKSKVDIEG